ncbi:MAG TPA: AMP-binding protein [Xanthobacteraceae bacterium]|nr:AMP-binding protein [Xanthobacteraceae bacterium]
MRTWFERILFHTHAQPETPAIVMEDRVVTYAMLRGGIERCAHRLNSLNVDRRGPIAVIVKNPLRHLVLCYALHRIGIPSISLACGQSGIASLSFPAILRDGESGALAPSWGRDIEVTDAWFAEDPDAGKELPPGFPDSSAICRVSLTSGATGIPKSVQHAVAAIGRRVSEKIIGQIDSSHRGVLCLPGLSANFGYTTSCAALAAGRTLYFAESLAQAVRMIELFAIDFVMASTEQLLFLTRTVRRSGANVQGLRTVWFSGSIATRLLLETAATHLCKELYCRYGATEAGLIAQASAREMIDKPGLAGLVVPDAEVAIVDAAGRRCPTGQIGVIKVRHGMEPADTSDSPQAGDGWVDLGDLGWLDQDRRLYVVGRVAEGSALTTESLRALEVEHLLQLEWDARDVGAVFVAGAAPARGEVWVGIVNRGDGSQQKLDALLQAHGMNCAATLFDVDMIPRGPNGKVNRGQLRAMLSDLAKRSSASTTR